jgi:drug/metabolite transporter (DMT)-like permease
VSAAPSLLRTTASLPAPSRAKLLSVLGAALLSISTAGPLIVACGMHAPALGFWRVLIAGSIQLLIATALERGALFSVSPRDLVLALAAGSLLGLHYFSWILSLEYTTVASSTVLATSNPLWVALGAWAFLREKTSGLTWAAIGIGIAGAVLLAVADAAPSGTDPWSRRALFGDGLAILGALTSSATLLLARALRARIPALTYVSVTSLAAAPVLLLAGVVLGSSFVPDDARQAGLLLAVALVPHLIGNTALNWALGWLPAPRVALVILGEPVGATVLAWAFLDQTPRPLTFVGAALVMIAVALSLRPAPPSDLRSA